MQDVLGEGLHDPALGEDGDPGDVDVRDDGRCVGDHPCLCGPDSAGADGRICGDYRVRVHQDAGREHDDRVSAGEGQFD